MQRGSYVIALAEELAEGGLVIRGEAQSATAQRVLGARPSAAEGPADGAGDGAPPAERLRAALATLVERAAWRQGGCVLVLPTGQVSHRRLAFAFRDPRKIRQVLPFELENELLDDLGRYAYDADIVPQADGTAEVHVYLVDKALLDGLAEALEAHGLSLQRVLFSAQALALAHPPAERSHFHVYVGGDESFVTHSVEGRLRALLPLSSDPGALLARLPTAGSGSPQERLHALFREGGADPEQDPQRQALQETLRQTLRDGLEATLNDANRLLRIHAAGEPCAVSLHGVFGGLFMWHPETSALSLRFPQGAWPGAQRTYVGVLEELLARPRPLFARGLNFYRRVGTWVALTRELRWPLAAAALLVTVLIGLAGTSYTLRADALEGRLRNLERQLQASLDLGAPVTTVAVNAALTRTEERVERLRRERQAVAHLDQYHYDTLTLFRDLSEAVRRESSVTVDSLSFNQERFVLSGTTPSYADSEALKERIGALPRFQGRRINVSHSNVGQTIRYRLTAER